VLPIQDAADRLNVDPETLQSDVPPYPSTIGLLAGQPPTLFRCWPPAARRAHRPTVPAAALWHPQRAPSTPGLAAVRVERLLLGSPASSEVADGDLLSVRLFHHCVRRLLTGPPSLRWQAAVRRSDDTHGAWHSAIGRHLFDRILAPQLASHCVHLQSAPLAVAACWQALKAFVDWLIQRLWPRGGRIQPARLPVIAVWPAPLPSDGRPISGLAFADAQPGLPIVGLAPAVVRIGPESPLRGIAWQPGPAEDAVLERHDAVTRFAGCGR
jgi:hypothetical protein